MAERSARGMLASLLYQPDPDIKEPWYSKRFGQLTESAIKTYNTNKMYKGNKLDDTYKALVGLLDSADSEAGMKIYDQRLDEFSSDSLKYGGFDDNIVQAEELKLLGSQKNQMRIDFDDGVQKASDFIDSGEYLSQQSDFENLPSMVESINTKRIAANKNPYEGTLKYLVSEKERTLGLMDKILPGMKFNKAGLITGTNFRYNQANNNDKDTARKIVQYYNRIELATKTLEGDGIITPDEARAILIGDMDDYIKTRDTALDREKGLYIGNKALFARYSGYINTAEQKKLGSTEFNYMASDPGFTEDTSEYQILGQELGIALGEDATQDDWDRIIQTLVSERNGYKKLMDMANTKYKYWSGDFYEGEGEPDDRFVIAEAARQIGVTPEKYREIQKNASDRFMDIDEYMAAEKEAFKQEPDEPIGESVEVEVPEETKPSYIAGVGNMHKELAKKHKTPIKNIKSLWNDYNADDDIKMSFDDYVGEAFITTPEDSDIAIEKPLYETYTNKRELRYGEPVIPLTTKSFKAAQSDLASIVSDKFNKLTSSEKNKYKGSKKEATRKFVKDEFEKWLKKTGKYGKPYGEGDFKYFFPTKVDASGKVNKNPDANIYTVFYPPAFDTISPTGLRKPNSENDSAYPRFAKDFDAFRKFLQES
jgi:hypothetical protein